MAGKKGLGDGSGHPLNGGTLSNLLRVLAGAGFAVDRPYRPILRQIARMNLLTAVPRTREKLQYGRIVQNTKVTQPPLFILGHWRTGTTHLHNLITRDPQWGYLSTFEAFAPHVSIIGQTRFKDITRSRLPASRPMDGMAMDVDLPQEEEFALGNMCPVSSYGMFYFPRLAEQYFHRYLTFETARPGEVEQWKRSYDQMVRKTTHLREGRPLVLKNPPNTARVKHLLDLYPDAKIIYLYRSPQELYLSTVRMMDRLMGAMELQDRTQVDIPGLVLSFYPAVIRRFFDDLPLIPKQNLAVVRYEDMKQDSLGIMKGVYDALGLPGWGQAEAHFQSYLDSQSHYLPARYRMDEDTRARVEEQWGPTHKLHEQLEHITS